MRQVPRLIAALALAVSGGAAGAAEKAHFVVTDEVAAPAPSRFATSLAAVANGGRLFRGGSGFEPVIYRDWFLAGADAENRVIADFATITLYDSLADGALDGAEVDILRIENGRFRLVRRDLIPEGGFNASGWVAAAPGGQLIPPDATSHIFVWDGWNRRGAPYHFTLRAVDETGALSPRATPIRVFSPARPAKGVKAGPLIRLDKDRAGKVAEAREGPGDPDLAPPAALAGNVLRDGALRLTWRPPADGRPLAGYLLERADTPPERHEGFFIELAGRGLPAIRAGDLVAIRKKVMTGTRAAVLSNRVWLAGDARRFEQQLVPFFADDEPGKTWRLRRHPPETPVAEPGETYLELELERGKKAWLGGYTDAGRDQQFYDVLDPAHDYRVEVWLRADRPTAVQFRLAGFHGKNPQFVPPTEIRVGRDWALHSFTVRPKAMNPGGAGVGAMQLLAQGPVRLHVDNFRVYRDDAPYMALTPEDAARMARARPGALRTPELGHGRRRTYDIRQLTEPGGVPSSARGNSLPQLLAITADAGADAWIQIQPHFTPEEWRALAEYLAAPFDPATDSAAERPWAARRAAQGRAAPWTDAFERIYLEIGNETWNRIFRPWTFERMTDGETGQSYAPGEVYGLYQDYVMEILRGSPYWTEAVDEKVVSVLGGWEWRPEYGEQALSRSATAEMLTTAPYIDGWEAEAPIPDGSPRSFANLLTHGLAVSRPLAARHAAIVEHDALGRGTPVMLGTYEGGPGYVMNGLNGARVTPEEAAAQERVMKSVAAGAATLDAFLGRALMGYRIEHYFMFGSGDRWRSHAADHLGGQEYPAWQLVGAFNREAVGDLLVVETVTAPRADLPPAKRRTPMDDAPMVGAYATRAGDRLALILVSRMIPGGPGAGPDGMAEVTVDLPIRSARAVRRIAPTGRYDDHNVEAELVRLEETAPRVPASLPRFEAGLLPPGSVQIYIFEGVE